MAGCGKQNDANASAVVAELALGRWRGGVQLVDSLPLSNCVKQGRSHVVVVREWDGQRANGRMAGCGRGDGSGSK